MKIKRVWNVLTKDGFYTFFYLLREKLRERKSEAAKYRNYIQLIEPSAQNAQLDEEKSHPATFGILVWPDSKENLQPVIDLVFKQSYQPYEVVAAEEAEKLAAQIQAMNCEYIGFVRAGDILAEHCLKMTAITINRLYKKEQECIMIYTDEDQISQKNGRRSFPVFKPDYSPDTFYSYPYIGGFWCARKDALLTAAKQMVSKKYPITEYELQLLTAEQNRSGVYHLKGIYYHRTIPSIYDRMNMELLQDMKRHFFEKIGVEADIIQEPGLIAQHMLYDVSSKKKVSMIIPSKDNPKLLKKCLDSIAAYTAYSDYEIILVDNGSSEDNKKLYQEMLDACEAPTVYHYEPMEFNFSHMCNIGAGLATGQYYLFLNDDIEITKDSVKGGKDWLSVLLGQAMQKHAGAVGAKLYYPNSTKIQHIGVVNYETGAAHIFSGCDDREILKDFRNRADYNYLCITGACMLVDKEKFHQVGGFSEELSVTFNDVDLCMKLYKAGFYQVVRNDVCLFHHESITRGNDALDPDKFKRHLKEREKLFLLEPDFVKYDPFYSPYLTSKLLEAQLRTDYKVLIPSTVHPMPVAAVHRASWRFEAVMQSAVMCQYFEIKGYAYDKESKFNLFQPVGITMYGTHSFHYFPAKRIYDPTLKSQLGIDKNINFSSFTCSLDLSGLQPDSYEIAIILKVLFKKKWLMKKVNKTIKIN